VQSGPESEPISLKFPTHVLICAPADYKITLDVEAVGWRGSITSPSLSH
jgi:hypothetical protein